MTNVIQYRQGSDGVTADTSRGPSPVIWGDCPVGEIIQQVAQGRGGVHFFDDFLGVGETSGTSLEYHNPYLMLADSATASIYQETSANATKTLAMYGQLVLDSGTTADADCIIQYGGGGGIAITDAAADAAKVWFESRWKVDVLTNDLSSIFIGLCESDSAVAEGVLTATQGSTIDTAWADKAMIGFWVGDNDGDGVNYGYGANGQTAQQLLADAHTLVADTFVKMGFVYDPAADDAKKIKFFINGLEQTTNTTDYVTATNIAAATFPDGEAMTLTAANKSDGATARFVTLDWWRVAMDAPPS